MYVCVRACTYKYLTYTFEFAYTCASCRCLLTVKKPAIHSLQLQEILVTPFAIIMLIMARSRAKCRWVQGAQPTALRSELHTISTHLHKALALWPMSNTARGTVIASDLLIFSNALR